MSLTATINDMRLKRLDDGLRDDGLALLDAPRDFPAGQPSQVSQQLIVQRPVLRPLTVTRVGDTDTYSIEPGFLETLPVRRNGRLLQDLGPISLPPGSYVYARCQVQWHRAAMTFQEAVGDPPHNVLRTRHYKNGRYTLISAEIITHPVSGTPLLDTTLPAGLSYFTDVPDAGPETQHFLLATIAADGSVSPETTANIWPAKDFALYMI